MENGRGRMAEVALFWVTLGRLCSFFAYPAEIRKVIYTTNAIKSLNMGLRKVTKTRGSFPNDEALFKLY